ncbi:MAG: glycine cleavage T C-terminal barrel domain-containing protein [Myxococcota bacterium]|nr:glycine cleavage T C-terminal barrel domain-containing protein [Myxococcota bacterium]
MTQLTTANELIHEAREKGYVARLGPGGQGLADPGWIVVSGPDALSFAHSQVTNEVEALAPGQGNATARVTRQGQLVELLQVYRLMDRDGHGELGILIPRSRVKGLLDLFEESIFADDVVLCDKSDAWEWWALQGPQASSVLDELFPRNAGSWSALPEHSLVSLVDGVTDLDAFAIRYGLAGDGGFLVGLAAGGETTLNRSESIRASAVQVGLIELEEPMLSEVLEVMRIEAGVFRMGPDTAGRKRILPETGLEQFTVSYTKGCYLGQEVIARVRTYGALPFSLRGLTLSSEELDSEALLSALPDEGEALLLADGSKIGQWASRAYSPMLESVVAFAYLDKSHRVPGTELDLQADAQRIKAHVQLLPFYRALGESDRVAWLYDRAVKDFAQGHEDEALAGLEEALRVDPSFSDGYEALGVILGRSSRFHEAIDVFKRLEEIAPEEPMVNTNLSLYFMKVGDKETAEAEAAKAVRKEMARASGHRLDETTLDSVLEEERRSDALRKKEMFGQVLEIDADDGVALFGMGNALSTLGDWDGAIAAYVRAEEVDSDSSAIYLAHGKVLEKVERFEEALAVYRAGMEVASRKGDLMPLGEMEHRVLLLSAGPGVSGAP